MSKIVHLSDKSAGQQPWGLCNPHAFPWNLQVTESRSKVTCKKCRVAMRRTIVR